jgi:hypothetical protein
MADTQPLIRALEIQAEVCAGFGSAFSAGILRKAATEAKAGGPVGALFAPWADVGTRELFADAVPMRLLGALHDLALSGTAPGLAAAYPGDDRTGDVEQAWLEIERLIDLEAIGLAAFMNHEPQTNEVRRSCCLLPGFLTIAGETELPLRCLELGASAGLNQLWDRYRYEFGAAGAWGPDSTVILDTEWRGATAPLDTKVSVIERGACDRKPVDIEDPIARRRLEAYIWADQRERLARLAAAIDVCRAAKVRVEAADAVAWVRRMGGPRQDVATVIFHSVFFQYLPASSQGALVEAISALGAKAQDNAPLAWLRMEPPPDNLAAMELRLTMWPSGEERILANVHPHGAWVEWLAG